MNSDLQNKLYHFEADPPKEVWNKIASALDAEASFPQRLFNYEENPPEQSWSAIEASLGNEGIPAQVVPFTRRFKKPVRYATAASLIAFMILAITLSNKKTGADTASNGTQTIAPVNQSSIFPTESPKVVVDSTYTAVVPSSETKDMAGANHSTSKRVLASIRPQAIVPSLSMSGKFIPGNVAKESLFNSDLLDSYMVYSDGAGNAMKLPKKLFNLVHCEDGDGSCKERIHQLQQKLATSAMPSDFAGILEILRQLQ